VRKVSVGETSRNMDAPMLDRIEHVRRVFLANTDTEITSHGDILLCTLAARNAKITFVALIEVRQDTCLNRHFPIVRSYGVVTPVFYLGAPSDLTRVQGEIQRH